MFEKRASKEQKKKRNETIKSLKHVAQIIFRGVSEEEDRVLEKLRESQRCVSEKLGRLHKLTKDKNNGRSST